ncbi:MAG: MoxR-like ATPase [Bacteroidia bacterium]
MNKDLNPSEESQLPEANSNSNDFETHSEHVSQADVELGISAEIQQVMDLAFAIKTELGKVIVGQKELMNLLAIALLIRGHILIEGVPGIAKTLTAKLFAQTIDAKFSRIQFTPDLMPSDVLGTNVFNVKSQEFDFKKGPIFADIIVVDEINRAPAKTQAAMFEVMQENQVSIDGTTRTMGEAFMVIATQNPIDNEGTYSLPEAQLDRFLFKVNLGYPSAEEEIEVLERFKNDFSMDAVNSVQKVVSLKNLLPLRKTVESVHIGNDMIKYIGALIQETRQNGDLNLGASTRASVWLLKASKAAATLQGRNFVSPDDIKFVLKHVLNHRIILSPQREMEGADPQLILDQIIEKVEVPR